MSDRDVLLPQSPERLPTTYHRDAEFDSYLVERDVAVPMRDGVQLVIDVYRPDTDRPLPALLAFAIYSKDIQGPDAIGDIPPQPSWSSVWCGPQEAGDTGYFTSRGYIHVVGGPRGIGKSEGGGSREFDSYDLIEWIAEQPWCDGQVGMVGVSGFGAEQMNVARQRPPHLKAIFPFDPRGAYGTLGGFRGEYPGGVFHLFRYLVGHFGVVHQQKGRPGELSGAQQEWWEEAIANEEYKLHPHLYNVLAMKGQHMPPLFDILINPYVAEDDAERSESSIAEIDIPFITGSGWYGYTYKTHLTGAQDYWRLSRPALPKKLIFAGPAHLERPIKAYSREALRWYDHWLKGLETGVLDEPPVRYWLMGANRWESARDWPLPATRWTKLHLDSWERLRSDEFLDHSVEDRIPPDTFVQMPLTQTQRLARLRYLSPQLPADLAVVGPSKLKLYASIDQTDTNFIAVLSDVGPDPSQQTVREGERQVSEDLPETELTRGWLKASNRALDEARTTPWKPFHKLTRSARQPVTPGEIVEYDIEILSTANLFKAGHRIALDIYTLDQPTGVAGATNAEYVPYHVGSAKTTVVNVFHDTARPSHLLLPVIPGLVSIPGDSAL